MALNTSRQIYLNSADASIYVGGSHSDVIWNFVEQIHVPDNFALTLGLLNAQIPASFFTINSTNDTLTYNTGTPTSITLKHGNPNVTELIVDLVSKLPNELAVTYDAINNKLTFTRNQTGVFHLSGSAMKLLGFSPGRHTSDTESTPSLTSNHVIDLSGPRVIFLESDMQTRSIDSRSKAASNILAAIPNSEAAGTILAYSNLTGYFSRINSRTISSLRIKLKDNDDNLIDLQGLAWSCTLQVNVIPQ